MPALDERSGLQALYFLLDDAVALAGGCFQTLVVENPNYSLPVRDQTGVLEYASLRAHRTVGHPGSGPGRRSRQGNTSSSFSFAWPMPSG